jgi:tetratricopeptide (TPR) repeat protein
MRTHTRLLLLLNCAAIWQLSTGLPAWGYERWAELVSRADTLVKAHQCKAALPLYEQALSLAEKFGDDDPRLTSTLYLIGRLYLVCLQQNELAAKYLEREQAILSKLGPDYVGLCPGMELLAKTYTSQRRYPEAEKLLLHELKISPGGYFEGNRDFYFNAIYDLTEVYCGWGKIAEAKKCFSDLFAHCRQKYGKGDHSQVFAAYMALGNFYRSIGQLDEAAASYKTCVAMAERNPQWEPSGLALIDSNRNLGLIYAKLGKPDEAERCFKRAIEASMLDPGSKPLVYSCYYPGLAAIERDRKHFDLAEQYARKALVMVEQKNPRAADEIRNFIDKLKIKR